MSDRRFVASLVGELRAGDMHVQKDAIGGLMPKNEASLARLGWKPPAA